MRTTRLGEFGQERDNAEFRKAEGQYAGTEGRNGPFDRTGLLLGREGIEMSSAPVTTKCDRGDCGVDYAADLHSHRSVAVENREYVLSLDLQSTR